MQPPTVLVADVDLEWSRPLRAELRRRGVLVQTASTIREMLELAERHSPEFMLLDGDLEAVGSGALVRLIRDRSARTSIALLFSGAVGDAEELRRDLGLRFCGPRPKNPEVLLEGILSLFRDRLPPPRRERKEHALVFCVDDDALFLRSLERILTRHGYRVETFEDPDEALQAVPEKNPDLAIVDILMPGLSGLDLAEEIDEDSGGRIPVILLSARSSDGDIVKGYKHHARYYITKPCEPQTILDAVDYFVGDVDPERRAAIEARL